MTNSYQAVKMQLIEAEATAAACPQRSPDLKRAAAMILQHITEAQWWADRAAKYEAQR